MALVVKDRVQETTTTAGTGTYTLAGAVTGYQSFSVIGDGNTTYYAATNGTDWEVGIGTYTASGTTLARTTILTSSNSNNAVNWSAGTKAIFVTYPAGKSIYDGGPLGTPSSGTVTNLTGTASININGTVGATTPTTGSFTTLSASGVATFSAGTASAPAITTSGDTNNGIFFPATDATAITTAGVERVRVNSSGNVGIGTASPSQKLQVVGGRTNLYASSETYSLSVGYSSSVGLYYIGATNSATPDCVFSNNAGTERIRITDDGRFYGTALHNNSGSVTGTTNQYVASGVANSGNATGVTNITGTPTYSAMTWMRVGNVVTVAGSVSARGTTANTESVIRFPLPIASAFTSTDDCSGSGYWTVSAATGVAVRVRADTTNDQAEVRWIPSSVIGAVTMPIHFTYLIR